jgi:hypothetical protein
MKFTYGPDPDNGYSESEADFLAQEHDEEEDAAAREAAEERNPYRQMAIDMATAHAAVLNTAKKEVA